MLKVSFEPPKFPLSAEVTNLLKNQDRQKKKKQEPLSWTHKERVLVGVILALTILASLFFWYKGQGFLPTPDFSNFGRETIIIEK